MIPSITLRTSIDYLGGDCHVKNNPPRNNNKTPPTGDAKHKTKTPVASNGAKHKKQPPNNPAITHRIKLQCKNIYRMTPS